MKGRSESAFHALVRGRVQGIGFRYSARAKASSLGVTGWVRNLDDGSVEVVAEGSREDLDELLAWLRRGPAGAEVSGVDLLPASPTRSFTAFSIEG